MIALHWESRMRKIAATLIFIGAISTPAWAQAAPEATDTQASEVPAAAASASTTQVEVELNNGIVLKGSILTNDAIFWAPGKPLVFTPENGAATTLTAEQVKSVKTKAAASTDQEKALQTIVKVLTPEVSDYESPGGFRYANVGKSRHLYAPSSIGMKQGEGYFSQKWLFSAGAYGVTDNLTLLAGTLTVFPPAVTIAGGKISGEIADNVHLSAGAEVFMTGLDGFDAFAKVGFGGITVGHDDKQLTLGEGESLFDDLRKRPVGQ